MASPPADLAAWRKQERTRLLALREALPLERRRAHDASMTEAMLAAFGFLAGKVVGFYWPMKGEFDPRVFVHRLRERGSRGALPIVVQKAAPMSFREWWPGVATDPGVFGLPVPRDSPTLVPDVVLMPPVGFDARGYRLGYGGGYFDRTLASLSPQPLKIGVGRESSRIETIHPQPYDIPMDFVVTEAGVHAATSGGLRRLDDPREAERLANARS